MTITRYDWFTDTILANGDQLIAIHPADAADARATVILDQNTSILVNAMLNALANEPGVEWSAARQACLCAAHETQAAVRQP